MKIAYFRIRDGYESFLLSLKNGLSDKSKDLFCPYRWNDERGLREDFFRVIERSEAGIDTSYIIVDSQTTEVVGHCFLWKAGGNPDSQVFGVKVPELGICIVDKHQRKGLGKLTIKFLLKVARELKQDAVELTTAPDNIHASHLYSGEGFEKVGIILNSLGVDATDSVAVARATNRRIEHQMVCILNEGKRDKVMEYLTDKRNRQNKSHE